MQVQLKAWGNSQGMQSIDLFPTNGNVTVDCFNLSLLLIGLIHRQPETTLHGVQLLLQQLGQSSNQLVLIDIDARTPFRS